MYRYNSICSESVTSRAEQTDVSCPTFCTWLRSNHTTRSNRRLHVKTQFPKLIAASAVIGLATALLAGCSSTPATPQAVVKAYLEAVQDGNAERALELVRPDTETGNQLLLTDEVLKASDGIENIVVYDALVPNGDGSPLSSVKATYEADGKIMTALFNAEQADGDWIVTPTDRAGLGALGLDFSDWVGTFTVNGIDVTSDEAESANYAVFPGSYSVDVVSDFVSFEEPYVYSTSEDSSGDGTLYTVNEDTQSALTSFTTTFMDDCFAASTETRADNCLNWQEFYAAPTDAVWTLDRRVEPELEYSGGRMSVEWQESFAYTISFVTTSIYSSGEPQSDSSSNDSTLSITPTIEDDEIVFTVDERTISHENGTHSFWS